MNAFIVGNRELKHEINTLEQELAKRGEKIEDLSQKLDAVKKLNSTLSDQVAAMKQQQKEAKGQYVQKKKDDRKKIREWKRKLELAELTLGRREELARWMVLSVVEDLRALAIPSLATCTQALGMLQDKEGEEVTWMRLRLTGAIDRLARMLPNPEMREKLKNGVDGFYIRGDSYQPKYYKTEELVPFLQDQKNAVTAFLEGDSKLLTEPQEVENELDKEGNS